MTSTNHDVQLEPTSNKGSKLLDVHLHEAFLRFAGKREAISNAELVRWFKAAKTIGRHLNHTHMDVSFYKVKKLGAKNINFKEFLLYLDELLVKYMDDTKVDRKDALVDLKERLSIAYPTITSIEPAVVGAVDRLTDVKSFTGTFKHIFKDLKNSPRNDKYDNTIVVPSK